MQSRTHVTAFLLALVVTALATPVVRRLAHRYGLYDAPDLARKIHRVPIPRLGGIAIALGFFAPLVGLLAYDNNISRLFTADLRTVTGLFAGGLAILAVGVYDDVRGLRARHKLMLQLAVAATMWGFGYQIERIGLPWVGSVELGTTVSFFATLAWFAAIMNAVNLIDGLDGLAGGVAFFALGTMYVIASVEPTSNLLTTLYAAALAGAVVGFLFYNFNPATIFMGDCGSLFLGLMLAAVSIQTHAKSSAAIALTVSVVALGLPIVDTFLSILRRMRRGAPVFGADREHIHHRLLALGFTPRQVAFMLYALCFAFGVVAVWAKVRGQDDTRMVLIIVAVVVLLAILNRFFRFRELLHQRRLSLVLEDELALPDDARVQIRGMGRLIRSAKNLDEAWTHVRTAADLLCVRDVELKLYVRRNHARGVRQSYSYHRDEAHLSQLEYDRLVVPLMGESLWYGDMLFSFRSAAADEDLERRLLLNLLGEYCVEQLETNMVERFRDQFTVTRFRGQQRTPR